MTDPDTVTKCKWVVALIAVEEEALPMPLGALPDALYDAIAERIPVQSLQLDTVFLLTEEHKQLMHLALEASSLPFHDYVVEECGEPCKDTGCAKHGAGTVTSLAAWKKRRRK